MVRQLVWCKCACGWSFFFQAEDGIRDYKVTGVQTCALPICRALPERIPALVPAKPSGECICVRPPGRGPLSPNDPGPGAANIGCSCSRSRRLDRKSVV